MNNSADGASAPLVWMGVLRSQTPGDVFFSPQRTGKWDCRHLWVRIGVLGTMLRVSIRRPEELQAPSLIVRHAVRADGSLWAEGRAGRLGKGDTEHS